MPNALPLMGAGNLQKIKARDVLPQGSSGHFARLPMETGECLSAAEHNAPVAVHTQWHQSGIAYGTNASEYLANAWFSLLGVSVSHGNRIQRPFQYSEERVDKRLEEYDSDLLGRMCFPHPTRNESLCSR